MPERQSDARNFEVVSTKYQEGEPDAGKAGDSEKGSGGLALIPAFGEYQPLPLLGTISELMKHPADHPRYIRFEGRLYRFERYSENKTFGDPVAMLKVRCVAPPSSSA